MNKMISKKTDAISNYNRDNDVYTNDEAMQLSGTEEVQVFPNKATIGYLDTTSSKRQKRTEMTFK